MYSNSFTDFPEALWHPFASEGQNKHITENQFIYLQETEATCFYYLKTGKVKSFIQSEDGNQRILHIYNQGAIFGEAAFFDKLPRVSSAIALTPCEVSSIDRKTVESLFTKDPTLALSMIQYLARTVRLLSTQVDDMAFRPAPQRLARYLLSHMDSKGKVPVTQDEIATTISVSRVTVSRILSGFTKDGILETNYGMIHIKNKERLEKSCEF